MTEKTEFQVLLEDCQGFRFRMAVESSFHQPGTVNENVLEGESVPLCDGTSMVSLTSQISGFWRGCRLSSVSEVGGLLEGM